MPDRPAHLVRLTSRPNEMEAGIVVATLEENGIRAAATGATTAGFRAEAPGWVHVLVAEEDVARAAALLEEIDDMPNAVDWSQVDVGKSEDQSTDEEHDDDHKSTLAQEQEHISPFQTAGLLLVAAALLIIWLTAIVM